MRLKDTTSKDSLGNCNCSAFIGRSVIGFLCVFALFNKSCERSILVSWTSEGRKRKSYLVPTPTNKRCCFDLRGRGEKDFFLAFIPLFVGSKNPNSNFSKSKEVRRGINCP